MKVTEIKWCLEDSDGFMTPDDLDLPYEVDVPDSVEEDEIADWLSDQYGWCVESFSTTKGIKNRKEIDGFVSVVNSLIEAYCNKYPDEYEFDKVSIGYTEDGRVFTADGEELENTLAWVNEGIIPDLLGMK